MNAASELAPMMPIPKTLYTARVRTTGGRDGGVSVSDDRRLEITHSRPGSSGRGTNPEQLLAAGWSACFEGAMVVVARRLGMPVPGMAIDAEIDLVQTGDAYSLAARLNVSLPGIAPIEARAITDAAEKLCPYSIALRGSIPIEINLV